MTLLFPVNEQGFFGFPLDYHKHTGKRAPHESESCTSRISALLSRTFRSFSRIFALFSRIFGSSHDIRLPLRTSALLSRIFRFFSRIFQRFSLAFRPLLDFCQESGHFFLIPMLSKLLPHFVWLGTRNDQSKIATDHF